MFGSIENWRNAPGPHGLAALLAAATFLCPPTQGTAQVAGDKPLRVLILNSFDQQTDPWTEVSDSFVRELRLKNPRPTAIRYFDLYHRDGSAPTDGQARLASLQAAFGTVPPDLVVALGPPAIYFWQSVGQDAYPDVPLLGTGAEVRFTREQIQPGEWGVFAEFSFHELMVDVFQLLPDTRRAMLVFGASPHERALAEVARQQIQGKFKSLSLEFTNDLSLEQLIERVRDLKPGSVVVFGGLIDTDAEGVLIRGEEALALIHEYSAVPVFGPFDGQLGKGIVGGRLIPLRRLAGDLATTAHGILDGNMSVPQWQVVGLDHPRYDWRELKAWKIPLKRLPKDSTVMFRPPSLVEQYLGWIIAAVIILSAQTALIMMLMAQRRQRLRAEHTTTDLSSRLITAHEDERRLIARELHDDLSQRLARLSIDASLVLSDATRTQKQDRITDMKRELIQLGKDVHDLSYRLHPSLLEELGLANALRAECDRLRRHTRISIVRRIEDVSADLPLATQLNIYRIGQEALHNAVRHSGADTVEIELRGNEDVVSLAVKDNGRGFDVSRSSSSLGLMSMRERARLLKGSLEIRSEPQSGTTVRISVPGSD